MRQGARRKDGVFMDVVKNIGRAVGQAAAALGRKHRKTAALNRIRTVIRCEERAAQKEYLALGRYYYNALRDRGNLVTEPHCAQLDEIEARLERALEQMQACAEDACPCGGDCEEITLEDVECFDGEPGLELEVPAAEEKDEPEESAGLPFEG